MIIEILWSNADECYIAMCNRYPSMKTHGPSEIEALNELVSLINEETK